MTVWVPSCAKMRDLDRDGGHARLRGDSFRVMAARDQLEHFLVGRIELLQGHRRRAEICAVPVGVLEAKEGDFEYLLQRRARP